MTREDIFKTVDHTLLAQTATSEEIQRNMSDDSNKCNSIYVFQHLVKEAKDMLMGKWQSVQ